MAAFVSITANTIVPTIPSGSEGQALGKMVAVRS